MKVTSSHNSFTKEQIAPLQKKASQYAQKLARNAEKGNFAISESALYIAGEATYHAGIKRALARFKGVKRVLLIGIGGSSLGTEAIYGALRTPASPALTVLDEINPDALRKVKEELKRSKSCTDLALVIVSKSGSTTETILNAASILECGETKFGDAFRKQVVLIGSESSALYKMGKKKKLVCLSFPDAIPGRYSVFTAVGIVPLMLLGIDTVLLRKGAMAAIAKENLARAGAAAATLALYANAGTHTVNFFTFNPALKLTGYWFRQLLAESIGKNVTKAGTPFVHQLLPVVTTSVDLHSMAELYLGGYPNMHTHFVHFRDAHPETLPKNHWILEHMPFLAGKDTGTVHGAIIMGVEKAYAEANLPYRITELEECTPFEVGSLLASLMYEVMCLAHLFDIDAFNQPSVELYKKHTRAVLGT